jgi:hypothetical protein
MICKRLGPADHSRLNVVRLKGVARGEQHIAESPELV